MILMQSNDEEFGYPNAIKLGYFVFTFEFYDF